MSYSGVEHPDRHQHRHCGNEHSHPLHCVYTGGTDYYVCTGQKTCEHDRDDRYDGLS